MPAIICFRDALLMPGTSVSDRCTNFEVIMYEFKLEGVWRQYRCGEGANDGYFEVLMDDGWKRIADVTEQRDGFETRKDGRIWP